MNVAIVRRDSAKIVGFPCGLRHEIKGQAGPQKVGKHARCGGHWIELRPHSRLGGWLTAKEREAAPQGWAPEPSSLTSNSTGAHPHDNRTYANVGRDRRQT